MTRQKTHYWVFFIEIQIVARLNDKKSLPFLIHRFFIWIFYAFAVNIIRKTGILYNKLFFCQQYLCLFHLLIRKKD